MLIKSSLSNSLVKKYVAEQDVYKVNGMYHPYLLFPVCIDLHFLRKKALWNKCDTQADVSPLGSRASPSTEREARGYLSRKSNDLNRKSNWNEKMTKWKKKNGFSSIIGFFLSLWPFLGTFYQYTDNQKLIKNEKQAILIKAYR